MSDTDTKVKIIRGVQLQFLMVIVSCCFCGHNAFMIPTRRASSSSSSTAGRSISAGKVTTTTTTTTTTESNHRHNNRDLIVLFSTPKKVNPDDPIDLMRSRMRFGSEEGKEEEGEEDGEFDDDTDDYNFRQEQVERREKVQELLMKQDEDFRREQKEKSWGIYANATTAKDIELAEKEERQQIQKENAIKLALAKQSGVNMELLEAKESEFMEDDDDATSVIMRNLKVKRDGNFKTASASWFEEMEEDLEQEWDALSKGVTSDEKKGGKKFSSVIDDVTKDLSGGLTSRERMKGIRVGSAGGWTLEIYPGDFIVHQKYGIGRFEQTVVRKKTKLTKGEVAAQARRRHEIVKEWLLTEKNGTATAGEVGTYKITRFGEDANDTDPVSNPHQTVLEISYADGIVHVPIDRAYRLSRYKAGDALVKPKLSKVRSKQWENAKRKVEENTQELAQDVLALYATRETLVRDPFDPKYEDVVTEFSSRTFPYTPTSDQKVCFDAVENDMVWRRRPMDRLICGDVGFGKTEVALRAIIRCMMNGRQAAFLAPTGVLAAQHFKNTVARLQMFTDMEHDEWKKLLQRGDGGDSNSTLLDSTPESLFRTGFLRGGMGRNTKNGREAREAIASGEWKVIVGTHALLGKDIDFQNLGLLVIDEEQRFGVKQKERLKLICSGVDVLTMSATPIPRTLQMSLSGIRDTSQLMSPPPMRKATITTISKLEDDIIVEAITTELARGGQCFYVVPRISMMEEAQERIVRLFPGISIIQAHGRMGRNLAEQHVALFAEGKFQLLLATTVIENGVDIPTVNTIIIQNAQNFGMSTLYQLRGRVGRSDAQAYAYFLHAGESVTAAAAMRLQAIGDLSALGSGMDVANRDLEIRGAGSLLGTEQSGMAARVGFDLYMRMLKKSIRQLRGLDIPLVPRTNFLIEEANLEALFKQEADEKDIDSFLIPPSYVPDPSERFQAETARLAESTNGLVNITQVWKQNYGTPLPAQLQKNLKTMHLHVCAKRIGVDVVGIYEGDIILRCPGIRPRHLQQILKLLPKPSLPKGLQMVFPSRMMNTDKDDEDEAQLNEGGIMDLRSLLEDPTLRHEDDANENGSDGDIEDWDALDQEEAMALKEISSAMQLKGPLQKSNFENHPRYVVKNFGDRKDKVHALLQLLLPLSKVIYEQQEGNKQEARIANQLRTKRESIANQRKIQTKRKQQNRHQRGLDAIAQQYGGIPGGQGQNPF